MEAQFNSVSEGQKESTGSTAGSAAASRRQHARYPFFRTADWDFFTSGTGSKPGWLEDVSEGGCLLRTTEPVEHRRWIRLAVKQPEENLWFTAVGRVIRREDRMEAWDEQTITLYRYGIEFIHPLNTLALEKIQSNLSECAICHNRSASIPDLHEPGKVYCVLCNLRRACHSLLIQDESFPAEPA